MFKEEFSLPKKKIIAKCDACTKNITSEHDLFNFVNFNRPTNHLCRECSDDKDIYKKAMDGKLETYAHKHGYVENTDWGYVDIESFDTVKKPEHYHKNGMDTFTFLENGFKPEIARGFYIGNIIKYLQRAESKGGLEDYEKAYQYMKTLLAFETELKTREK